MGTTKLRDCCEPKTLFAVERLFVSFGVHEILRDVSLEIVESCKTVLIGPSGSGKSTFLLALSRLILLHEDLRIEGSIRYRGEELYARGGARRDFARRFRREVGFVFQKPTPFPLSIWNNLEVPLRESGRYTRDQRPEKIVAALETVGLWAEVKDRLKHPANTLSGGQQQRLCIARALALDPKVLLMDEPTSSLDPIAASMVESVIERISGDRTVVIVTHNIAQARRIADYLVVFWAAAAGSNVVECGEASLVFERPQHSHTAALIAGAVS